MQQIPKLPLGGPTAIEKGKSFKNVLGVAAIECMAQNIRCAYRKFDVKGFVDAAKNGLGPLAIMQRGEHIAHALRRHLPDDFEKAVDILIGSLTPPLDRTKDFGLGVFFYLPHSRLVANYGLDPEHFETSMAAQYELTQRFTAEFSIRPFLIRYPERTLARLLVWTTDKSPHVRRLCSEGSRPRLPWAQRIPSLIQNPKPTFPILEALKDDPEIYVRRSVANHVGDIAKDNLPMALELCARWKAGASPERQWLIAHALRYPARQGNREAIRLRRSTVP